DKELREFDEKMKELQAGFSQSEKQRILMEISSVSNELSAKIDQKELKLRNDTVDKLTVIESTLSEEYERGASREKALVEKVESQLKEMRMYSDENNNSLKQVVDKHEIQSRERINE
ncbi:unnamed protein product, partial [Meganyctiphanes norvegica]